MLKKEKPQSGFADMQIAESILGVLDKLELTSPTPIQKKSIPVAISGQDIIGIAQTGTGKTFAFGIPMIQRLAVHKGRGLILLPTRELALQVEESMRQLGNAFGLRTASLIGGMPVGGQMMQLRKKPHVIIATPGRLIDLIKNRGLKLMDVKVLVLDEADLMFDMGFQPQIEEVLKHVPKERQTMLFSATMPQTIIKLAATHMQTPVSIEVAPAGTTIEKIVQEMHIIKKEDKLKHLEKILAAETGSILIFARTRHGAHNLTRSIQAMGHKATEIHSDRSTGQRREALAGFKSGKFRILVATDIAARGIDVKGITLVLNYDLPDGTEDYVHRIGRTGRAGLDGKAISFATPSQGKEIRAIEKLIRKSLPQTKLAELEQFSAPARKPFGRARSGNFSQGQGRPQRFGERKFHSNSKPARSSFSSKRGAKPSYGQRPSAPANSSSARPTIGQTDRMRFMASMRGNR